MPLRQLPGDVARVISVACLEARWNLTTARTKTPVLFTRISSVMCRIALTTHTLWVALHIPILVPVPPEVTEIAKSIMTARTWRGLKVANSGFFTPLEICPFTFPSDNQGNRIWVSRPALEAFPASHHYLDLTFRCRPRLRERQPTPTVQLGGSRMACKNRRCPVLRRVLDKRDPVSVDLAINFF